MKRQATLAGGVAIGLWSLSLALTRSIAEVWGPFYAGAVIYTASALFMWLTQKSVAVKSLPRGYIWGCGGLFVLYMVAFTLAIGLADSAQQVLEVGLINYLWPSLTLILAIPILGTQVKWWFWLGVIMAFVSILMAIRGDTELAGLLSNLQANPIVYFLALLAAVCWALYSNLLRRFYQRSGALPLFLTVVALIQWVMAGYFSQFPQTIRESSWLEILLMGASTAIAYSCWDYAMKQGNATLVVIFSYFTPLFSMITAALWLQASLSLMFLLGVIGVITGSLLCWSATQTIVSD